MFGTTASNTKRLNGVCILLKRKIGREILCFGCGHHISEIVLAAVFIKCNISMISGLDIPLFKRFKPKWADINNKNYLTGIVNEDIVNMLGDNYHSVLDFANHTILTTVTIIKSS